MTWSTSPPEPWSGPDAVAARFGWQVWVASAAAIAGLAGLFLIGHIRFAMVTPVAVLSWVLARFQPDDPVRRTVTGLPYRARALPGRARGAMASARPVHSRADLIAPLRAAMRRPATWLLAAPAG